MAVHGAIQPESPDGVPGLSHAEAVRRAAALAPALRARLAQTDALRRIPDATVADLLDAGLFGLATPRAWNGAELWPETWVQVIVELASACGSTGLVLRRAARAHVAGEPVPA